MTHKLQTLLVCSAVAVTLTIGLGGGLPLAHAEDRAPEIQSYAAATEPPAFDSAEAAIDAFKAALASGDGATFAGLLGIDAEKLKANEDAQTTFAQIREGAGRFLTVNDEAPDRQILLVGLKLWPLPFPLVKGDDGKWAFDTYAGLQEIVNRRVGENELEAIATMQAYVEAQGEYASQDRDMDGVEEFAQKLISSEGLTDGLYWPSDEVRGESPVGDAIDQAEFDAANVGDGYFGYRFRVLTGQGNHIAGGAYDYVINSNMIAGFALIGWPATYGETGVHSFMVNQHGIVYEADLGPATEAIVKYVDRFNPDDSWKVIAE